MCVEDPGASSDNRGEGGVSHACIQAAFAPLARRWRRPRSLQRRSPRQPSARPGTPAPSRRTHGAAQTSATLPYQDPSLPIKQRVQDLLSRMTLAEKIGQMTQAERASVDTDTAKITRDNLGSLLSGGGSVPTPNTPKAWADMVDRYQRAALATRLHIPLIYGIDIGARRREHVRGHGVPPQHRPRRQS